MAWRLHEHVLRGRIDNRARGCVTGEIWLAGIDQQLVLELKGDCEPDVAGWHGEGWEKELTRLADHLANVPAKEVRR